MFWVENCARLPSQVWVCSVHFDESKESKLSSQSRTKGLALVPPEAVAPPEPRVPPDALAPPEAVVPPEDCAPAEALLEAVVPPVPPALLELVAPPETLESPPRLPPDPLPPVPPARPVLALPLMPALLVVLPPLLDWPPEELVPSLVEVPALPALLPGLVPPWLEALLPATALPPELLDILPEALAPPSVLLPPALAPPLLALVLAVEPPEAFSEEPEVHPTKARAAQRRRTERKDNSNMDELLSSRQSLGTRSPRLRIRCGFFGSVSAVEPVSKLRTETSEEPQPQGERRRNTRRIPTTNDAADAARSRQGDAERALKLAPGPLNAVFRY